MAARYVTVCGKEYNKTNFGKKWSEIVSSYEADLSLSEEDTQFMIDVLRRVERFDKIIRRGKVSFKIVYKKFNDKRVKGIIMISPNSGHEVWVGKQNVMKVIFPSSTVPDRGKVNRKNALKALRSIIDPQIKQYRSRCSGQDVIKSSLTGKPIFGAYHVDHVYPFIRLVEEWCRENGIDLETLPLKCRGVECKLQSVEMAESWFDYHAFHAELQILDASENVSKGARYFGRNK